MLGAGPAVLDAGAAWFEEVGPAEGTVCATFGRAAYLRFGPRLLAVCGAEVSSGPLHLRLDRLPVLAVGQRARWTGRRLEMSPPAGPRPGRGLSVEIEGASRWVPRAVAADALRRAVARWSRRSTPSSFPPGLGLPDDVLDRVEQLLDDEDLLALARLVGGRGPGLTPAGDDVLAGVLVTHSVLRPEAEPARRAAAAAAATTDVAAAFLRWAARGQCIEPVHQVLEATASGRPAEAEAARARLRDIGASSGAALLLGLDLALEAGAARSAA